MTSTPPCKIILTKTRRAMAPLSSGSLQYSVTYQEKIKHEIRTRSIERDHKDDFESYLVWLHHQLGHFEDYGFNHRGHVPRLKWIPFLVNSYPPRASIYVASLKIGTWNITLKKRPSHHLHYLNTWTRSARLCLRVTNCTPWWTVR